MSRKNILVYVSLLHLLLLLATPSVRAIDEIEEDTLWDELTSKVRLNDEDIVDLIRISEELARQDPDDIRLIMNANIMTINRCISINRISNRYRQVFDILVLIMTSAGSERRLKVIYELDDKVIQGAIEAVELSSIRSSLKSSISSGLYFLEDLKEQFEEIYNDILRQPCKDLEDATVKLRTLWDSIAKKDPDYEIDTHFGSNALALSSLSQVCNFIEKSVDKLYIDWNMRYFNELLMGNEPSRLDSSDIKWILNLLVERGMLGDDYVNIKDITDIKDTITNEQLDKLDSCRFDHSVQYIRNLCHSTFNRLFDTRVRSVTEMLQNIEFGERKSQEHLDDLINFIDNEAKDEGIVSIFHLNTDTTDYLVRGMANYWKAKGSACPGCMAIMNSNSRSIKSKIDNRIRPICSQIMNLRVLVQVIDILRPLAEFDYELLKEKIRTPKFNWVIRSLICRLVMRDEILNDDIVEALARD